MFDLRKLMLSIFMIFLLVPIVLDIDQQRQKRAEALFFQQWFNSSQFIKNSGVNSNYREVGREVLKKSWLRVVRVSDGRLLQVEVRAKRNFIIPIANTINSMEVIGAEWVCSFGG